MGLTVRIVLTALWIVALVGAAITGKVSLNDEPLPPLLALLVGPIICVGLGIIFALGAAVLLLPLWVWLL